MDMQIRLQRTKQDWTSRLEDFGHRIQQQQSQNGNGSTTNSLTSSSLSPFRVLLQLFAYEDVLDNHKLDTIFDMDDGVALTFYVPQLLSFLLHGALYTSPALEEWILNKCRKNIYFAHKCYWYLRAWCLEVPAESRPITPSISRRNSATSLSSNNLTNGAIGMILSQQQQNQSNNEAFPFLDEPAVLEKKQLNSFNHGSSRNLCLPDNASVNNSNASQNEIRSSSSVVVLPNGTILPSPTTEKDKFLIPEERAMIERFMMRVKECGQIPASKLEYGATVGSNEYVSALDTESITYAENINPAVSADEMTNYEPIDSPDRPKSKLTYRGGNPTGINGSSTSLATMRPPVSISHINNDQSSVEQSSISRTMASLAENGKIPIDPISGSPSLRHYNTLLLQQTLNVYGFHAKLSGNSNDHSASTLAPITARRETEQFDKTPQFLDALIFLAENLYYIPRENRRETLQQQLRSLECELLPSNSIYLPIGSRNQYHRVWRIVAEESIAISTKERVPCIVALEVIDFSMSVFSSSSANTGFDHVNVGSTEGTLNENANHVSGTNRSVSSPTSLSQTCSNDFDAVVAEWRYGYRNPLRYVPFLDKVTTSVKVPFAKMKTQVRDHFNHLRDRGVAEEMQALSSADALVDSRNQGLNINDPIPASVIEGRSDNGNNYGLDTGYDTRPPNSEDGAIKTSNDDVSNSLSRMNNAGSFVSLGQWSSPSALCRAVSDPDRQLQNDLNDVRFRLDTSLSQINRRNSPLLYGSDQEDEPSERSGSKSSGRPPSGRRPSTSMSLVTKESNLKDQENAISSRPPPVVFRESWVAKQERVRQKSAFGDHPGWKLLAILVKGNDDLRQEQLAAQLIQRMATILACERVNVWLCPYEIIATTDRGGVIEAIPDTISLDSLKKNDPNYTTLNDFFRTHYGEDTDEVASAKANFVESLAAYSMVCFILQLKDRHNGNILLDKWGHVIHIDFGFFFLSSPGKNAGFESAPFKLTREFVELLEGTNSHLFRTFRELCFKTFIALRRRCMEIILLVEMLKNGNEDLKCFRGRPDDAIQQLHDRFRLDLNDRACKEYVNCLIDDSIENWRTDWYDRYQRYFVGVL
jgi:phosphatidylinositol 4-kinase B